eukprot:5866963-Alexandrium_andersonii.AAC.1
MAALAKFRDRLPQEAPTYFATAAHGLKGASLLSHYGPAWVRACVRGCVGASVGLWVCGSV